jgi:hypothetical protein
MADDLLSLKDALEEIEQTLSVSRADAERLLIEALSTSVRSYGRPVFPPFSDRIPLWRWRGATLTVGKYEMRAGARGPVYRDIRVDGDDFFHWIKNCLAASTLERASAQQLQKRDASDAASSLISPPRKRGPPARVLERVKDAMISELRSGCLTKEGLEHMPEKTMEKRYDASRDTCRKARQAALSQFVET